MTEPFDNKWNLSLGGRCGYGFDTSVTDEGWGCGGGAEFGIGYLNKVDTFSLNYTGWSSSGKLSTGGEAKAPYNDRILSLLFGSRERDNGIFTTGRSTEIGVSWREYESSTQNVGGESYELGGGGGKSLYLGLTYFGGVELKSALIFGPFISSTINFGGSDGPANPRRLSAGAKVELMVRGDKSQEEEKKVNDVEIGMEVAQELVSGVQAILTRNREEEIAGATSLVEDATGEGVAGQTTEDIPLLMSASYFLGSLSVSNDIRFYKNTTEGSGARSFKVLAKVVKAVGFILLGSSGRSSFSTAEGVKEAESLAGMLTSANSDWTPKEKILTRFVLGAIPQLLGAALLTVAEEGKSTPVESGFLLGGGSGALAVSLSPDPAGESVESTQVNLAPYSFYKSDNLEGNRGEFSVLKHMKGSSLYTEASFASPALTGSRVENRAAAAGRPYEDIDLPTTVRTGIGLETSTGDDSVSLMARGGLHTLVNFSQTKQDGGLGGNAGLELAIKLGKKSALHLHFGVSGNLDKSFNRPWATEITPYVGISF